MKSYRKLVLDVLLVVTMTFFMTGTLVLVLAGVAWCLWRLWG